MQLSVKQIQSAIVLTFVVFFAAQITLLSPSNLEQDASGVRTLDKTDLIEFLQIDQKPLATGIPKTTPTYSMRGVTVYSYRANSPGSRVLGEKASAYMSDQIIHLFDATTYLNDYQKDETKVTSKEAKVLMQTRTVYAYGDVHAEMKDGSSLDSQYAELFTQPERRLEIPVTEFVTGNDGKPPAERTSFTGNGLSYTASTNSVFIHKNSVANIHDHGKPTIVHSDSALLERGPGKITFTMDQSRPIREQFVHANQPDLAVTSRILIALSPQRKGLDTLIAINDVDILDTSDPNKITHAKAGHAVFQKSSDDITLTEYPIVYQNNDTITGDTIVYDRVNNVFTVDQSNASKRPESAAKPNPTPSAQKQ